MSRKVSAAGGSEKSMVALQLPSLMPPLYRGDGSLLKFLEFTVFTFATPSEYIYIYYVRAIPLLATINTTSTVDDLEKRIKENIAWNVELVRAFRGTLTRTKNKYNGVISRGRERRQSVSWSVLLFLLLSQPERRNSPRLEKRKRRLNRRKIEGETCLGGPSLAARKNYFRRLLTSLLDEKEAASLASTHIRQGRVENREPNPSSLPSPGPSVGERTIFTPFEKYVGSGGTKVSEKTQLHALFHTVYP